MGALRHLTHSHPDISFAVGMVTRFIEKPTSVHTQAVKQILRYVKGTLDFDLIYNKGDNEKVITRYTDNDLAKDVNDTRSTTGTAYYLNANLVTRVLTKATKNSAIFV